MSFGMTISDFLTAIPNDEPWDIHRPFSFKSWATGETVVPDEALPF